MSNQKIVEKFVMPFDIEIVEMLKPLPWDLFQQEAVKLHKLQKDAWRQITPMQNNSMLGERVNRKASPIIKNLWENHNHHPRIGKEYEYVQFLHSKESAMLNFYANDELKERGILELIDFCLTVLEQRAIALRDGKITPTGKYLTQKANGIHEGWQPLPSASNASMLGVLPYQPLLVSFKEAHKIFARPAPLSPRHGFVESRIVKDYYDLLSLFKEAIAQDLFAEVILMEQLSGEYSAIATNAGVTWGFGNDGVTSAEGDKKVVTIPNLTPMEIWNELVYKRNKTQAYYLELVVDRQPYNPIQSYIVQRREGPAQTGDMNFIPNDTVVTHVVDILGKYSNDLIKWEKHLKSLVKGVEHPESIVFYYPGGVLSSHYAVHAIELGMSVITKKGEKPAIGSTLTKAKNARHALSDKDLKLLAEKIKKWDEKKYIGLGSSSFTEKEILNTAIGTFHANAQWDNSPVLLDLRAMSFTAMARFLSSAVVGELRHYYNKSALKTNVSDFMDTDKPSGLREEIYATFLQPVNPIARIRLMKTATMDYKLSGWRSGFGGKKWATVASRTRRYVEALYAFSRKPSQKSYKRLILAANIAMHVAHNNGPTFGKWLQGGQMNMISKAPTTGFLNAFAATFVLEPEKI